MELVGGYDTAGYACYVYISGSYAYIAAGSEGLVIVKISGIDQNNAPELNPIGDKTVNINQLLQFTVSATDKDGDKLTYSASGLPSGATFQNQEFKWTPTVEGNYKVTFIVSVLL